MTSKKEGLLEVNILRSGTVGLAYHKRNATLNGLVLDKYMVEEDESGCPVLLNHSLFNKRSSINFSIVCESFCTLAHLSTEDMWKHLQGCEVDYEFWKQFYDSDQALDENWTTKKCEECNEFHTMFNCPKLTYMPLKSMVYMKHCFGKQGSGLRNDKSRVTYSQAKTNYLKNARDLKNREAMTSPLKFWNKIFKPWEKLLEINFKKFYHQYEERGNVDPKERKLKLRKPLPKVFDEDEEVFEVDRPEDFEFYYRNNNPKNLIKSELSSKNPNLIPRFSAL